MNVTLEVLLYCIIPTTAVTPWSWPG